MTKAEDKVRGSRPIRNGSLDFLPQGSGGETRCRAYLSAHAVRGHAGTSLAPGVQSQHPSCFPQELCSAVQEHRPRTCSSHDSRVLRSLSDQTVDLCRIGCDRCCGGYAVRPSGWTTIREGNDTAFLQNCFPGPKLP